MRKVRQCQMAIWLNLTLTIRDKEILEKKEKGEVCIPEMVAIQAK